ncbi:unnamed protein product [Caenorhabditis brenneri]
MEQASGQSVLKQVYNVPETDQHSESSIRHSMPSCTQNEKQSSSNKTESQENKEVRQERVRKVPVKKNQLRTNRRMNTDVGTEIANSDVAPVVSQATIKKGASNNKKSKMEQEHQKKSNRKRTATNENQDGSQKKRRKAEKKIAVDIDEEQGNSSNPVTVELEVAVARDALNIEIIPLEQRSAFLKEVQQYIESERDEMLKKSDANENKEEKGEEKWDIVCSALKKVANILSKKSFLTSPLPIYNEAVEVFRTNRLRCGHQREEESRLLDIFQEFARKMSLAFCCGKFNTATQVYIECKGHESNCNIEDGDACYVNGKNHYCAEWCESSGKTRGMKKIIYRHFKPEAYEECGKCKIVWHPKCRQLRLVKKRNGHPCQKSNDMVEIPNFSQAILTTPFQRRLSQIYHHNRGDLPELTFIHSTCIKKIPDNRYTKNALPVREDFEYTANQIFVTVPIENVDTMIFSMNTQEYRSGPRKGFVVIELLDSIAILKEKRSNIYKRIIWSYLKYARESGFKFAHLYSCAAEGGVDYIFGGHPLNQVFLEKAALNGWYKGLLEEGNKEFGKMDIGYAEEFFNKALSQSTVSEMCRSLVFGNGFLNDEVEKILQKMPQNKEDHFEDFKNEIQKFIDASKESLFFVKLQEDGDKEKEITDSTFLFSSVTSNWEEFLDEQYDKDIEFTDLRQAQYATRQILMELYLTQAAQIKDRKPPNASSVFSKKQIVPTWKH